MNGQEISSPDLVHEKAMYLRVLSQFLPERLLWPPLGMPSANLNGAVMLAWTLPLFLRCFHFADWFSLVNTNLLSATS